MGAARRIAAIAAAAAMGVVAACAAFRAADTEDGARADDASENDTSASDVSSPVRDTGDAPGDAGRPNPVEGGALEGGDAAVACNGAPACVRHVFMTSTSYLPTTIVGPTVAYGLCSDLVNGGTGPLKGRTFEAWVSVVGNAVVDRLVHGTKQYVNTNGSSVIAANWTALTSGTLANGITLDEKGDPLPASDAWTGTNADGTSAANCGAWTSADPGVQGVTGTAAATSSAWTNATALAPCNVARRLICVEQ